MESRSYLREQTSKVSCVDAYCLPANPRGRKIEPTGRMPHSEIPSFYRLGQTWRTDPDAQNAEQGGGFVTVEGLGLTLAYRRYALLGGA